MPKSKKYLIACSGGPDSMALLDQYRQDIVCIVHVNYHYRDTADRDENIVCDYAKKHKLKLKVYHVDAKEYIDKRFNFESWAREVRYRYFVKIAKQLKIYDILMAHHLDDWLETALMQVERNSQTTYYGIKEKSKYEDLNIYRPFINKRKKELLAYCKKHKIPYGIDETNADTKFTRNRIRESLKGFSQKQFDKYIADFTRMNKQLAKLEDFSNQAYEQWKEKKYYLPFFLHFPIKIQKEMLYKLINEVSPKRMSLNKIDGLMLFIKSPKGSIYYRLSDHVKVYKKDKYIKIIKK